MGDAARLTSMLEREWGEIDKLCSDLTDDGWNAPTDLPGWTVKDVVSHLNGVESLLLGRAPIDHAVEMPAHVKNPLGERNEVEVDWRRPWPWRRVLDEFREVTRARVGQLKAMSDEDFGADVWTPTGPGTYADFMSTRVLDCWVHEQDLRRAVADPGHLDDDLAAFCFRRLMQGMPKVVGKNAAAPDGTVVVFDISGIDEEVPIGVSNGRGGVLEATPRDADVRLVMDLETFVCLSCGRWPPERTLRLERVQVQGERELGTRVVSAMNVMF
jgi:uncharacterized protein (TIGR03083 family)